MFEDRDSQTDIKTRIMDIQEQVQDGSIQLTVLSGQDRGREFVATGSEMSVGRSPECDFVLKDRTVSRRHFVLSLVGDSWIIRDAGSGNGTSLNGVKITGMKLKNGDRISAGNSVFKVTGACVEPSAGAQAGARPDDDGIDALQEIRVGTPAAIRPVGKRNDSPAARSFVIPAIIIILALLFLGAFYARSCGLLSGDGNVPVTDPERPRPERSEGTIRIPVKSAEPTPTDVTAQYVSNVPSTRSGTVERHVTRNPLSSFKILFGQGKFSESGKVREIDPGLSRLAVQSETVCAAAVGGMAEGNHVGAERELAELSRRIEDAGLKVPARINRLRGECLATLGTTAAANGKDMAAADLAKRALALDPGCRQAKTLQGQVMNKAALYFNRGLDSLKRGLTKQAALDFTTVTRILPEEHQLYQAAVARMP
jgi:hypothetical protein